MAIVSPNAAIEYTRAGEGAKSLAAVRTSTAARIHIETFLATKTLPRLDDLNEAQLCDIKLFQELGTYLVEFATKKDHGKLCARKLFISCQIICSVKISKK